MRSRKKKVGIRRNKQTHASTYQDRTFQLLFLMTKINRTWSETKKSCRNFYTVNKMCVQLITTEKWLVQSSNAVLISFCIIIVDIFQIVKMQFFFIVSLHSEHSFFVTSVNFFQFLLNIKRQTNLTLNKGMTAIPLYGPL